MVKKKPKIVFVAHAAGAGQVLSSWIRTVKPYGDYYYCLSGPADKIFQNKLLIEMRVEMSFINSLDPEIDKVITGSGWNPSPERDAVYMAKKRGVYSISFVEHWTNYRERFLPEDCWTDIPDYWTNFLPNQVYVCDEYAYQLAYELGFPTQILNQINNPYLDDIAHEYFSRKKEQKHFDLMKHKILYICEPVAWHYKEHYGDERFLGYTEFDLVEDLVETVEGINNVDSNFEIRFRLHPRELKGKYDKYLEKSRKIHISQSEEMLEDMLWADTVIWAESMALFVACYLRLPTFSVIPATAKNPCSIPVKELKKKQSFNDVFEEIKNLKGC